MVTPENTADTIQGIPNYMLETLYAAVMSSNIEHIKGIMTSLICEDTCDCGNHDKLSVIVTYFCQIKNRAEVFVALDRPTR